MKNLFCFAIFFVFTITLCAQNTNISVNITDVRNNKGNILYALYDNADSFNDEKSFVKAGIVKASKGTVTIIISDVPDGVYALSVFHDENKNEVLDFNLLGMPREGFGFSMNPTIRFRQPNFNDCAFTKKGNVYITVEMKYFL